MKSWIINHLSSLFVACIAVISPIQNIMLTVGFLIIVDFLFGVYKSYALKQKITSRKMGNSVGKLLLYNLMILSVFLLDKYIINSGLSLEKIAAGLIGLVEIKSIDESFKLLFGFSIWDKIKNALKRGTSSTKDLLDDVDIK